jgi:hypothetical protein
MDNACIQELPKVFLTQDVKLVTVKPVKHTHLKFLSNPAVLHGSCLGYLLCNNSQTPIVRLNQPCFRVFIANQT